MILSRRWSVFALALFAVLLSSPLSAQQNLPWDQPAFATEPKALLAAAHAVPAGDSSVVVLLDERDHSFEANGRSHTKWRLMYRIVEEAAVTAMGQVQAPWSPWVHDRPTIEARVVSSDGSAHLLDSKAIIEAPGRDESLDIFSDNRVLRAPLPGIGVGAVVEYVISYDGNSPIAEAGMSDTFYLGRGIPVQRARLTIETPAALVPRIVNTTDLKAVVSEADGRRRMVFESGRIEAIRSSRRTCRSMCRHFRTWGSRPALRGGTSPSGIPRLSTADREERSEEADARRCGQGHGQARGDRAGSGGDPEGDPLRGCRSRRRLDHSADAFDRAGQQVRRLQGQGDTAGGDAARGGDVGACGAAERRERFRRAARAARHGRFNHAIVVVDGSPAIWVDPTDEFSRAARCRSRIRGVWRWWPDGPRG